MSARRAVALVLACLLAVVLTPAAAAAGTRTVSYHGYQVSVPVSWAVVDLAAQPHTCLRLDRPAVYLGHPGDQSACPAHAVGRTAGVVIEPLSGARRVLPDMVAAGNGKAAAAYSRDGAIQVAVPTAGVLVTAEHAPGFEDDVRAVLDSASLVPGGSPAAVPAVPRAAAAGTIVAPGTLLDKGFDACTAPSQTAMNAWRTSPYKAVGIYISGSIRACSQPNLTPSWVATNSANGWRFILIDVGRQNPCSSYSLKFSTDPATARQQGRDAASGAQAAAANLGFAAGSAIYSDIEGYSSTATCRAAMLSYVSGWTERLNELGFLGGVYSSAGSGMVDLAAGYDNAAYKRADHIWFAWWNGRADTDSGSYVPASYWSNHQRLHQYSGGHNETYGGVTINIDSDFLDVGTGTPQPPSCGTATLDFTSYAVLSAGSTGSQVVAAQCLLTGTGRSVDPSGTFDTATADAVKAFQTSVGQPADGIVGSHTWTALLAYGDTPTLRSGSTGVAVRRLQRALTAALGRTVGIDGQFGPNTQQAVRDYQTATALGVDGVVGPATWAALQAGR